MRPDLQQPAVTTAAAEKMTSLRSEFLDQVKSAVHTHDVVVVGMGWNPHVSKARQALTEAGIPHHALSHGTYLTGWRERLAVKLWSGWPTFPQVYVKGTLVGGASELKRALSDGTLEALLSS